MNSSMMDLPTLMSKFLAMGMPLKEVIRATTWKPAQIVHHSEVGHLSVGAVADITALKMRKGRFGFFDPYGAKIFGNQRLRAELTLKDGAIVWDWDGRDASADYLELPPDYGIRKGVDVIVRP